LMADSQDEALNGRKGVARKLATALVLLLIATPVWGQIWGVNLWNLLVFEAVKAFVELVSETILEVTLTPIWVFTQINPCVYAPGGACPAYKINLIDGGQVLFSMPEDQGIRKVNVKIMEMLQLFYALAIISIGIYLIFMSGSPQGRVNAKDMFIRVFVGMILVSLAPPIFQFMLDLVRDICGTLIQTALSKSSVTTVSTVVFTFTEAKYCCTMLFFLIVTAIAAPIAAYRYFLVYVMACLFPLTLFMYFTDIPNPLFSMRGIGTRLWKFTILLFMVQILQTLFLCVGLMLANTAYSPTLLDFILMLAAYLGVLLAPMIGMQMMGWIGSLITVAGVRPVTQMTRFLGTWMRSGSVATAATTSAQLFTIQRLVGDHVGGAPGPQGQVPDSPSTQMGEPGTPFTGGRSPFSGGRVGPRSSMSSAGITGTPGTGGSAPAAGTSINAATAPVLAGVGAIGAGRALQQAASPQSLSPAPGSPQAASSPTAAVPSGGQTAAGQATSQPGAPPSTMRQPQQPQPQAGLAAPAQSASAGQAAPSDSTLIASTSSGVSGGGTSIIPVGGDRSGTLGRQIPPAVNATSEAQTPGQGAPQKPMQGAGVKIQTQGPMKPPVAPMPQVGAPVAAGGEPPARAPAISPTIPNYQGVDRQPGTEDEMKARRYAEKIELENKRHAARLQEYNKLRATSTDDKVWGEAAKEANKFESKLNQMWPGEGGEKTRDNVRREVLGMADSVGGVNRLFQRDPTSLLGRAEIAPRVTGQSPEDYLKEKVRPPRPPKAPEPAGSRPTILQATRTRRQRISSVDDKLAGLNSENPEVARESRRWLAEGLNEKYGYRKDDIRRFKGGEFAHARFDQEYGAIYFTDDDAYNNMNSRANGRGHSLSETRYKVIRKRMEPGKLDQSRGVSVPAQHGRLSGAGIILVKDADAVGVKKHEREHRYDPYSSERIRGDRALSEILASTRQIEGGEKTWKSLKGQLMSSYLPDWSAGLNEAQKNQTAANVSGAVDDSERLFKHLKDKEGLSDEQAYRRLRNVLKSSVDTRQFHAQTEEILKGKSSQAAVGENLKRTEAIIARRKEARAVQVPKQEAHPDTELPGRKPLLPPLPGSSPEAFQKYQAQVRERDMGAFRKLYPEYAKYTDQQIRGTVFQWRADTISQAVKESNQMLSGLNSQDPAVNLRTREWLSQELKKGGYDMPPEKLAGATYRTALTPEYEAYMNKTGVPYRVPGIVVVPDGNWSGGPAGENVMARLKLKGADGVALPGDNFQGPLGSTGLKFTSQRGAADAHEELHRIDTVVGRRSGINNVLSEIHSFRGDIAAGRRNWATVENSLKTYYIDYYEPNATPAQRQAYAEEISKAVETVRRMDGTLGQAPTSHILLNTRTIDEFTKNYGGLTDTQLKEYATGKVSGLVASNIRQALKSAGSFAKSTTGSAMRFEAIDVMGDVLRGKELDASQIAKNLGVSTAQMAGLGLAQQGVAAGIQKFAPGVAAKAGPIAGKAMGAGFAAYAGYQEGAQATGSYSDGAVGLGEALAKGTLVMPGLGTVAGGLGYVGGLAGQIADEKMKVVQIQSQSLSDDLQRNRFASMELSLKGWTSGHGNSERYSSAELRKIFPSFSEQEVENLRRHSEMGFRNPNGWMRWKEDGSATERMPSHFDILNTSFTKADSINGPYKSETAFLDHNNPNWRYLLSTESGQREIFQRNMPDIYNSRTVQDYMQKLDSGQVKARNIAEIYASNPGLASQIQPSEFWQKSGVSPDVTAGSAQPTASLPGRQQPTPDKAAEQPGTGSRITRGLKKMTGLTILSGAILLGGGASAEAGTRGGDYNALKQQKTVEQQRQSVSAEQMRVLQGKRPQVTTVSGSFESLRRDAAAKPGVTAAKPGQRVNQPTIGSQTQVKVHAPAPSLKAGQSIKTQAPTQAKQSAATQKAGPTIKAPEQSTKQAITPPQRSIDETVARLKAEREALNAKKAELQGENAQLSSKASVEREREIAAQLEASRKATLERNAEAARLQAEVVAKERLERVERDKRITDHLDAARKATAERNAQAAQLHIEAVQKERAAALEREKDHAEWLGKARAETAARNVRAGELHAEAVAKERLENTEREKRITEHLDAARKATAERNTQGAQSHLEAVDKEHKVAIERAKDNEAWLIKARAETEARNIEAGKLRGEAVEKERAARAEREKAHAEWLETAKAETVARNAKAAEEWQKVVERERAERLERGKAIEEHLKASRDATIARNQEAARLREQAFEAERAKVTEQSGRIQAHLDKSRSETEARNREAANLRDEAVKRERAESLEREKRIAEHLEGARKATAERNTEAAKQHIEAVEKERKERDERAKAHAEWLEKARADTEARNREAALNWENSLKEEIKRLQEQRLQIEQEINDLQSKREAEAGKAKADGARGPVPEPDPAKASSLPGGKPASRRRPDEPEPVVEPVGGLKPGAQDAVFLKPPPLLPAAGTPPTQSPEQASATKRSLEAFKGTDVVSSDGSKSTIVGVDDKGRLVLKGSGPGFDGNGLKAVPPEEIGGLTTTLKSDDELKRLMEANHGGQMKKGVEMELVQCSNPNCGKWFLRPKREVSKDGR